MTLNKSQPSSAPVQHTTKSSAPEMHTRPSSPSLVVKEKLPSEHDDCKSQQAEAKTQKARGRRRRGAKQKQHEVENITTSSDLTHSNLQCKTTSRSSESIDWEQITGRLELYSCCAIMRGVLVFVGLFAQ